MRKISFSLFAFIFLLFGFSLNVRAAEDSVDDQAALFTSEEISQLKNSIAPIEAKAKARVFIVTNNDNNMDSTRFADYYMLDRIGKNNNGITFYLDMNQRKFIISTSGNMIDYLTDKRIDQTLDAIEPDMVAGNYFLAAQSFLEKTSYYFDQGVPGGHYRVDTETGKITRYKSLTTTEIIIAFIAASILSGIFFAVSISKYQLKFGTYKYPFREKSSLNLTRRNDILVNSFVTTRRIPKNNSSGGGGGGSSTHSSGGGSFGGGGRSF
ncbi:TPM domain-containing protein [Candidatus Enterococcus ikei]|uniref:TPM domain-containing protein n=1 Tax=Candidatus Enterococcus ikei TaxID=2815326 RepID=A0ABS3GZ34_9ENTE|nr:TPM domain-containing protein [Enterococcus sp. DIV0869a]MBO0439719.1 TPM domain-containing protein [Enterococcus sp. DIV0869a]